MGSHVIKCSSSTQATLALSSGEAELYGVVKGAGVGLGQQALFRDIGLCLPLRVLADSSAAIGICGRQGVGKVRHLACQTLWVQQKVRSGEIELRKFRGDVNPADLFTKHLESRQKVEDLVKLFGCSFREGRAASAPALRREAAAAVAYADLVKEEKDASPKHDIRILPHQQDPYDIERIHRWLKRCQHPWGSPIALRTQTCCHRYVRRKQKKSEISNPSC